ncbi:hypothetical protein TIFTF001_052346 [Ficus carica]|uniref:Uncharacterized protein n=1 Tax=Ficus carica TaxID=3494 RepID=A0AA88EM32_FICCA|nr:hypothetical protein TIFTF001_052346 [Ficus carica]
MLASGVAAEFAVTVDFQNKFESFADFGQFYGKSYASASLLLLAVLFNVVLSVLSSYALPKKESETRG